MGAITLTARDFARALVNIVPAAQRTMFNPAVALEPSMRPLLQRALCTLSSALAIQFPYARFKRKVELLDLPQGIGHLFYLLNMKKCFSFMFWL